MHGRVEPYYDTAAMVTVLVLLGQVLEIRARSRTSSAIKKLLGLAPKTARLVKPDGTEGDVPIELVQPGDHLRIRPGEKALARCKPAGRNDAYRHSGSASVSLLPEPQCYG